MRASLAMDDHGALKTYLHHITVTDASTVSNLPFLLRSLSVQDLASSVHIQKWLARIDSLLHSKDPSARWAGVCLALRTSTLSKSIMTEKAQGWLGTILPMLSVSAHARCP